MQEGRKLVYSMTFLVADKVVPSLDFLTIKTDFGGESHRKES